MINSTSLLFEIQKIDLDLRSLESRIKSLNNELIDNTKIEVAETKFNEAATKHANTEKESAEIDYKINDFKNKRQQLNSSLYSGKIQNSRELQDLQNEIESITQNISRLEDLLIQKWDEIEKYKSEKLLYQSELNTIKDTIISRKEEIKTVLDQLNKDINRLHIQRKGVQDQVSSPFLGIYNRLVASKKGVAIIKITDSYCSACGTSLTPSDCQNAKVHSQIIYCSNCGRIIYAD